MAQIWKRTIPTRLLETLEGIKYPSYIDSFLLWRAQLTSEKYIDGQPNRRRANWDRLRELTQSAFDPDGIPYWKLRHADVVKMFYKAQGRRNTTDGLCPQCGGKTRFKYAAVGTDGQPMNVTAWCLCTLPEYFKETFEDMYPYRRTFEKCDFGSFDCAHGRTKKDPKNPKLLIPDYYPALVAAYQAAKKFVTDEREIVQTPDGPAYERRKWLILAGERGSGKTHLMRAMATNLGPIALYVRTTDLEQMILEETFRRDPVTGEKNGDLAGLINTFAYAPYLLLDDLGAGHAKDFVVSVLLSILDIRYADPEEFPTVVSTNQTTAELRQKWGRLGDRLTDRMHTIIELQDVPSYRQLPIDDRKRGK